MITIIDKLREFFEDVSSSIKNFSDMWIDTKIKPRDLSSKLVDGVDDKGLGAYVIRENDGGKILGDNSDITSIGILTKVSEINDGEFDGYTSLRKLVIHNSSSSLIIKQNITNVLDVVEVGRTIIDGNGGIIEDVSTIFPNASKIIYTNKITNKSLPEVLKDLSRTIRSIEGTSDPIKPNEFSEKIVSLKSTVVSGWKHYVERSSDDDENSIIFGKKEDITRLIISNEITSVQEGELKKYSNLNELIIDGFSSNESSLTINSENKCSSISKLSLGRNINFSGVSPFSNNWELINLELLYLTKINDGLFSGCKNISQINIPSSVREIGEDSFSNGINEDVNSKRISFEATEKNSTVSDLVIKDRAFFNSGIGSEDDNGEVVLPISVSSIGISAFAKNSSLRKIRFRSIDEYYHLGLELGDNAFSNCPNLTHIYLPKKVIKQGLWKQTGKTFDSSPFYICESLQAIVFPENLEIIQDELLGSPSTSRPGMGLRYVKMPKNLRSIGEYSFNPGWTSNGNTYPTEYDFSDFDDQYGYPKLALYDEDQQQQSFYGIDNGVDGQPNIRIIVPENQISSWKLSTDWSILSEYIISATGYSWLYKPDDIDSGVVEDSTTTTTTIPPSGGDETTTTTTLHP